MDKVIIESPYKASGMLSVADNEEYLKECMLDCLDRGEAPFASHRMYTSALDDTAPLQRMLGISAGLEWGECADKIVVYYDNDISNGMKLGIQHYSMLGIPIEHRSLYE